jgi:tripartite-type tricarboxylate transporter receptor subunit TctC
MEKKIVIVVSSIVLLIGFNLFCWAAEYPSKTIELVSPYGVGGAMDLGGRIMGNSMSKYLGQRFNPVNKPGGDTTIGARYVISQKPDGYTVLVTAPTTAVFYPKVVKAAGYTMDDLTPLFGYGEVMLFVVVKADRPWKTLNDFIEDAKKHPNQFKHGSWGMNSFGNLGMAMIDHHAGIQTQHVPFFSPPEALNALLGGHIDIFASSGVVQGLTEAGRIRCLAISGSQRTDLAPGISTLTELGIPLVITFHHGFYVRNGIPKKIQETLIQAGRKASNDNPEEVKKRFFDVGLTPAWAEQEAYRNKIMADSRMYDLAIDLLKLPTYHKK